MLSKSDIILMTTQSSHHIIDYYLPAKRWAAYGNFWLISTISTTQTSKLHYTQVYHKIYYCRDREANTIISKESRHLTV